MSRCINAWLSPEGELFECKSKGHANLADKLAKERYLEEFKKHYENGEPVLEDHKWIKIFQLNPIYEDGSLYDDSCVCFPHSFSRATDKQKEKLKEIYEDLSPNQRMYADMLIEY